MANYLKITPACIEFPVVLNQSLTQILKLENITSNRVAFKIKTTAPKNYLVRPSTGSISKNGYQEIHIILQPLDSRPSTSTQDRFLVQSTSLEDNDSDHISREFWSSVRKSAVSDQRLCVYFRKDYEDVNTTGVCVVEDPYSNTTTTNPTAPYTTTTNISDGLQELRAKYDESMKANLRLHDEKSNLDREVDTLRRTLQEIQSNSSSSTTTTQHTTRMRLLWHWIPLLLIILATLKYTGYL